MWVGIVSIHVSRVPEFDRHKCEVKSKNCEGLAVYLVDNRFMCRSCASCYAFDHLAERNENFERSIRAHVKVVPF